MPAALSAFKPSVQSVCQMQQHRIKVSFEMTELPSMNSRGKSLHIDSKAVFSSVGLVGLVCVSSQYCTPYMISNGLRSGDLNISDVIFKKESV